MKTIKIKDYQDIPDLDNFTGILEFRDGLKIYYKNGLRHREDGPAFISSVGTKYYYYENEYHRIGGPAIEWHDASKEYWVDHKCVSKEAHDLLCVIMKMKEIVK